MSPILQQAVLHVSGAYLVTTGPDDIMQYEDSKGHVVWMRGGTEYLSRSQEFPGGGCVDFTLTNLDDETTIREKLLIRHPDLAQWVPISTLALDDLNTINQSTTSPMISNVVKYWISKNNEV